MQRLLSLLACAVLLVSGCEEGDANNPYAAKVSGGSSEAVDGSIVGTWTLQGEGTKWYGIFKADGSWLIADDAAGNKQRVYGTYTTKNGSFSGPMTNPGVGSGKISGTYSGNKMELDFTEYWHSPAKTVHYSGTR